MKDRECVMKHVLDIRIGTTETNGSSGPWSRTSTGDFFSGRIPHIVTGYGMVENHKSIIKEGTKVLRGPQMPQEILLLLMSDTMLFLFMVMIIFYSSQSSCEK